MTSLIDYGEGKQKRPVPLPPGSSAIESRARTRMRRGTGLFYARRRVMLRNWRSWRRVLRTYGWRFLIADVKDAISWNLKPLWRPFCWVRGFHVLDVHMNEEFCRLCPYYKYTGGQLRMYVRKVDDVHLPEPPATGSGGDPGGGEDQLSDPDRGPRGRRDLGSRWEH